MYRGAIDDISQELYKITEKINNGKAITLTDMHKFKRLDELQGKFENIVEDLGKKVETFGKENMLQGGKEVYKNVRTSLGNIDFSLPNKKLMNEMLDRPWLGDSFSGRLWKNNKVLAMNLNDLLVRGLTQGKTIAEISIDLSNRMNTEFNNSHRLVRTETMHYLNESAFKGYKDAGCEEVELWAAKDERTCKVCGAKHGTKYPVDKRPILPLHANCRCTYLPVIVEEDMKPEIHERVIRDSKFKVNKELLNSAEYEEKFNGIGGKKQNATLLKETKNILKKNDKLNSESMAIIDGKGKVVTKQDTGAYGGSIDIESILELPNNSVVLTHNHPGSTAFSGEDIALLLDNPQIKTIIAAGHDGTLYKLSVGKDGNRLGKHQITDENLIKQEYNKLYTATKDANKVVEYLVDKYNWKYEVL